MAQNLQTSNDIGSHATATLQSCSRPIYVQFDYTSSTTPKAISVQVYVKLSGSWVEAGSAQVLSKDFDSSSGDPTFTLNIAPIIKGYVKNGFYESIFTTASDTSISQSQNDSASYFGIIEYKAEARSYTLNSLNILELNTTDSAITNPSSGNKFACDIFIKDEELASNKFTNSNVSANWQIDATLQATDVFLTNCPSHLNRKVCIGQPLPVNGLGFGGSGVKSLVCKHTGTDTDGVIDTETSLITSFIGASEYKIAAANITPNDTYLFDEIGGITQSNIGGDFEVYMKYSSTYSKPLKFNLHNNLSTSNSNLPNFDKDFCAIYFVNDFNVIDFYVFDSFLNIEHNHVKENFKTGFKDYTSRSSSKFGVSSGRTEEVYTCSSMVNRDVSMWLSEIYRSREVYMYDLNSGATPLFIPIQIIDGTTTPLSSDKKSLIPFSISFIKDVHTINS